MKDFLVKIDKENPLFEKFKEWFLEKHDGWFDFSLPYYGFINDSHCFMNENEAWNYEKISLEGWYKEFIWQPKQGDIVEMSRNGKNWGKYIFICKYENMYIGKEDSDLSWFGEFEYCRKCDPLSEDIEKLKKKAKDLGLKIDIIYEKMD